MLTPITDWASSVGNDCASEDSSSEGVRSGSIIEANRISASALGCEKGSIVLWISSALKSAIASFREKERTRRAGEIQVYVFMIVAVFSDPGQP